MEKVAKSTAMGLAVRSDLLDRARKASSLALKSISVGASFILRNIFMLIDEGAGNDARSGPSAGI